jgi:hypothetical protein
MIAMLFVAAVWSAPHSLPHLVRGQSYGHARQSLLQNGWRPVNTNLVLDDGTPAKHFGAAGEMLDAGFVEIYDCSGTGRNFCTFIWKRNRQCIHVITYGEYIPKFGAPKIYTVEEGSCSKDD